MKKETKFFTKYIQKHRLNTIELLHHNKEDFVNVLRLLEHDTLVTIENGTKKILILIYYEHHKPFMWVVRYNKGGFAYGTFTKKNVNVEDFKKIYMWVNYNKEGALEIIDKEYSFYGNP